MAENTQISWADHTHNEWIGCARVSPGCDHCYAATMMDDRYGRVKWGGPGAGNSTRALTSEANRKKPYTWDRKAKKLGIKYRAFCSSLADVFDKVIDPSWRAGLAKTIRETPNLIWMLLTKRIGNAEAMLRDMFPDGVPKNVWLGATIVNQTEANRDIPVLIRTKNQLSIWASFISVEPMLGAIDLEYPGGVWPNGPPMCCDGRMCGCLGRPVEPPLWYGLNWVICGGESGTDARPMHPAWAQSLRDQCQAAGIPFLFKQWGEWAIGGGRAHFKETLQKPWLRVESGVPGIRPQFMVRDGKRESGEHLDGVLHHNWPIEA